MPTERLIQIGVAALRAPDGKPLPAVPLYIKAPVDPRLALTTPDEIADVSGLFAERFREYMKQTKGRGE